MIGMAVAKARGHQPLDRLADQLCPPASEQPFSMRVQEQHATIGVDMIIASGADSRRPRNRVSNTAACRRRGNVGRVDDCFQHTLTNGRTEIDPKNPLCGTIPEQDLFLERDCDDRLRKRVQRGHEWHGGISLPAGGWRGDTIYVHPMFV